MRMNSEADLGYTGDVFSFAPRGAARRARRRSGSARRSWPASSPRTRRSSASARGSARRAAPTCPRPGRSAPDLASSACRRDAARPCARSRRRLRSRGLERLSKRAPVARPSSGRRWSSARSAWCRSRAIGDLARRRRTRLVVIVLIGHRRRVRRHALLRAAAARLCEGDLSLVYPWRAGRARSSPRPARSRSSASGQGPLALAGACAIAVGVVLLLATRGISRGPALGLRRADRLPDRRLHGVGRPRGARPRTPSRCSTC